MTDTRATAIADFVIGNVTWQCWVVAGGSYEWRSACGCFSVRRRGREFFARAHGRDGSIAHKSLIGAMAAAQAQQPPRRAAG